MMGWGCPLSREGVAPCTSKSFANTFYFYFCFPQNLLGELSMRSPNHLWGGRCDLASAGPEFWSLGLRLAPDRLAWEFASATARPKPNAGANGASSCPFSAAFWQKEIETDFIQATSSKNVLYCWVSSFSSRGTPCTGVFQRSSVASTVGCIYGRAAC
jgi:hypothetical protein